MSADARHRGNRGWLSATLGVVVIALLLPLTTFLVAAWLLRWQLQCVQSGSMAPTYPIGSFTHRVVGTAPSTTLQFVTRGDADTMADPAPVPARSVRGRVPWAVSHIGSVMDWVQWPRSFIALVVVPGGLLALSKWRARRSARGAQSAAV